MGHSFWIYFFEEKIEIENSQLTFQLQNNNFSREMVKRPISFKCIKTMNTI